MGPNHNVIGSAAHRITGTAVGLWEEMGNTARPTQKLLLATQYIQERFYKAFYLSHRKQSCHSRKT